MALEVAQARAAARRRGRESRRPRLAGEHRRREGAADLAHRLAHDAQQVAAGVVGDERRDDLGVGGAVELDALADQLVAQLVVFTRLPLWPRATVAVARAHQGLRVLPGWRRWWSSARGRWRAAAEPCEHLLVEHLRDQAHVLDDRDLALVGHGDAGALLAAMLQGVEAEEGEARHVVLRREDAEDAATVAEVVIPVSSRRLGQGLVGPCELAHGHDSVVRSHPW